MSESYIKADRVSKLGSFETQALIQKSNFINAIESFSQLKCVKAQNFTMGKSQSKSKDCESEETQKTKRQIEKDGVEGSLAMMREKLESWNNVKIKIGVTGNSGVGKSSFINAIRGVDDDDDQDDAELDESQRPAKTGVIETTKQPTCYTFPVNPNILLVDLPGVGTPAYPNLDIYCEKVKLETYDTFLILTSERFTQLELELAQTVKAMGKSLFLVRTKMDEAERSENRKKNYDIGVMLSQIRAHQYEYLKDLKIPLNEIFLISNHEKDKWDFHRLLEAIVEKLPTYQKEALILSLRILSKDFVKRKVQVLKDRLWQLDVLCLAAFPFDLATLPIALIFQYVNCFRGIFALLKFGHGDHEQFDELSQPVEPEQEDDEVSDMSPVNLVSIPIALAVLGGKAKFFRSQLGLPEEDSDEFKRMKPEFQERMRKFYPKEKQGFLKRCFSIYMTPVHAVGKGDLNPMHRMYKPPTECVRNSLENLLDEMEQLALDLLDKTVA